MSEEAKKADVLEERIDALKTEQLESALRHLRSRLDSRDAALAHSCLRCGLCAETCHYYQADPSIEAHPAYKLNLVLAVFKRYFTVVGRAAPAWIGAGELDQAMIRKWLDSLFGRCSLCGRCFLNCTVGINIPRLIRAGRGTLASLELVPLELQSTVRTAVEKGNNMGIERQDWRDTVEWLQEELAMEVGDPSARMPLDEKGARILYTVNPREPKFFPLSLVAAAKIFHAAGESWTFSSDCYDVTNYGLFSGDDQVAGQIAQRLREEVTRLGSQVLVLGECGHGYNAHRWEAAEWIGNTGTSLEMKSFIEVMAGYVRDGRIRLDPSLNTKPVTLHDPCNLVRLGGVIEEQRFLLRRAVSSFVEMTPNREQNFCCGGGGGQLSMSRFARRRLEAGRIKAEQIRATGAKVVVAPCHNCVDQLTELNKEYKLGVEVRTVAEVVAKAVVTNG
ncbi:MAG: (Fe-S)-binding protein [Acidobacteria bacterium]|nr:MAG: (Fe-S)-binding protein [Acidobacteriota bacterium]